MQEQVPSFDMSGIGNRDSESFSTRLHYSGILAQADLDTVRISFCGLQPRHFLRIEDLATLTVIIRQLAERGTHVDIQWPQHHKGKPNRLYSVLEGIGFASLFDSRNANEAWIDRVRIRGRRASTTPSSNNPATSHYIPMRWFDAASFDAESASDIWTVRPEIPFWANRDVRQMLELQGFLDTDIVDLFNHVLLMELAWNVILHSDRPGVGYGLFCGQVLLPEHHRQLTRPRLTFCFADAGKGIPAALGEKYDESTDERRRYHIIHRSSRSSGIVRFSLDRDTSSRPRHVSQVDAEGCRGLAYVVNAMQNRGGFRIRSCGGAVDVIGKETAGVRPKLDDELAKFPLPGTQIVGILESQPTRRLHSIPPALRPILKLPEICHVADLNGGLGKLTSPANAAQIIASLPAVSSSTYIIDMGYARVTPRQVEYLCKEFFGAHRDDILVLWGLSIQWDLLQGLAEWIWTKRRTGAKAFVVGVHTWDNAIVLGVESPDRHRVAKRLRSTFGWLHLSESSEAEDATFGIRAKLNPNDCLHISREINSSMLSKGFAQREDGCGYYVGYVHLLSGDIVERYFSFSRNVVGKKANLERWVQAANCAMQSVVSNDAASDKRIVVLGFTAAVREFLHALCLHMSIGTRTYLVLSYDLPSTNELRSVVRPDDHVVLVTDVISTGSSARGLAELVQKLEAVPVAVIAAVDARRTTDFASQFLDIGVKKIPLFSCALVDSREDRRNSQAELFSEEFWVDPVSLVPTERRSELWDVPNTVIQRIEYTLDAICTANAAKCGHCVDGTRHMGTYIDLRRLLSQAVLGVSNYVVDAIRNTLASEDWTGFAPTHVVFPTGISRIEELSAYAGAPTSTATVTVYGTAVRAYVALLGSLWPKVHEVEIPRVFDPGGNSRCSQVVETLRESHVQTADVVIVDDGMWSGRTVSSLLRGVVEAGATRVLVVPLLARLRPTDVVYWESFRSVTSGQRAEDVPVRFFFPLIYPVPAYSAQDCPFEITSSRISEKVSLIKPLAYVGNKAKDDLLARSTIELAPRAPAFSNTWVRLRCHLELASESEWALENALQIVRDRHDELGRAAVLELLLSEWQLATRSRIRQAFTPVLCKLATDVALAPDTPRHLRLLATSALRSLFPVHFAKQVRHLAKFAIKDVEFLERTLFHVATLDDTLRSEAGCKRFLERVSRIDTAVLGQLKPEHIDRYRSMVVFARNSLLHDQLDARSMASPATSLTARAAALLSLIAEDSTVQHDLRPALNNFDVGRKNNLATCSQRTWAGHAKKWREKFEPLICEQYLPQLRNLKDVLLRAATTSSDFITAEAEYLTSERHESRGQNLASDVNTLHFGLEFLSVHS